MRSTLLIPTLLLFGACAVARVPPHAASSRFGVVHAADPDTAQEYARLLDDVAPFVARALPGLEVEPVDLRVVAEVSVTFNTSSSCEFLGAAFERGSEKWIEIRAELELISRRSVLAHELVHRWLGPAWSTLPPALEDGLADVIGDAIRGDESPRQRMRSFVTCWITLNGELTVDRNGMPVDPQGLPFAVTFRANIERLAPSEILDVMGRDLTGYHALEDPRRFAVVAVLSRRLLSRLSVDQLFEACRTAAEEGRTRVPLERIFELARIDPLDLADWNDLLLETCGLEERRALRDEVDVPWDIGRSSGVEGTEFSIHLQASVEF